MHEMEAREAVRPSIFGQAFAAMLDEDGTRDKLLSSDGNEGSSPEADPIKSEDVSGFSLNQSEQPQPSRTSVESDGIANHRNVDATAEQHYLHPEFELYLRTIHEDEEEPESDDESDSSSDSESDLDEEEVDEDEVKDADRPSEASLYTQRDIVPARRSCVDDEDSDENVSSTSDSSEASEHDQGDTEDEDDDASNDDVLEHPDEMDEEDLDARREWEAQYYRDTAAQRAARRARRFGYDRPGQYDPVLEVGGPQESPRAHNAEQDPVHRLPDGQILHILCTLCALGLISDIFGAGTHLASRCIMTIRRLAQDALPTNIRFGRPELFYLDLGAMRPMTPRGRDTLLWMRWDVRAMAIAYLACQNIVILHDTIDGDGSVIREVLRAINWTPLNVKLTWRCMHSMVIRTWVDERIEPGSKMKCLGREFASDFRQSY